MKRIVTILFVIVLAANQLYSQAVYEGFKKESQKHMQSGRYGEAIDLLNKYISALPHKADGLHLRGLCYEARSQYEWAALDLRRAIKLDPNNRALQTDLARVEKVWEELLLKKIEGHKREIAIDPSIAVNYLEIGKCKKNLGLWKEAETWYDEYLKRDENASSDEVIRYSEILAKNGSIVKGEKILKIYVNRYPNDQRLWSRYGFFTYWLGKNKIAIQAFENALALKPFFKEAQDGLDAAKGKPYLFEWVDTLSRFKKNPVPPEYPVDKYYRLVRKNPNDVESRYLLVDELLKHERLEEAYQQLQKLQKTESENSKFTTLWDSVTTYRQTMYNKKIGEYTSILKKDGSNRDAILKTAGYYANLYNYDTSIIILKNYLEKISPREDMEARYNYAQYAAWNKNWDEAKEQVNILLAKDKDNLDYQLLAGEILVWTDIELDQARIYLSNVIEKHPDNINALVTMGFSYLQQNKIDEAVAFGEKAKGIDSTQEGVTKLISDIEFRKLRLEEEKLFLVIIEGRELVYAGNCREALPKYEEYMSKAEPNDAILREYADVNACAGDYSRALSIYDTLLARNYDYDLALGRANTLYAMGDSVNALTAYQKLNLENPEDRTVQLFIGDSYVKTHQYGDARDIYEKMIETSTDSTEIAMVNQRIGWLPQSGFNNFFLNFPNYVGIAPYGSYYSDNMDYQITSYGGRLDFGLTYFLTGAVSFQRSRLTAPSFSNNLTTFKWHLFLRMSQNLTAGAGFGSANFKLTTKRNIWDSFIRFDNSKLNIVASFERTDAELLLSSAYLVNNRIEADYAKLMWTYVHKSIFKISGYFSYITLKDKYRNKGNDFQFRVGKKFYDEFFLGYEYFYINYKYNIWKLYYSPQRFVSHSLWIDWDLVTEKELTFTAGGKIGYIPLYDTSVREIYASVNYNPIPFLILSGRVSAGSNYRYDSSYNSFSTYFSVYLTL